MGVAVNYSAGYLDSPDVLDFHFHIIINVYISSIWQTSWKQWFGTLTNMVIVSTKKDGDSNVFEKAV